MLNSASSIFPLDDNEDSAAAETTPKGGEPIKWHVVAETPGILPAQIIADRLQSEGIPARAWQESVGHAFGFTVGPLGTGYVSVPEEFVDQTRAILDEANATDILSNSDEEE